MIYKECFKYSNAIKGVEEKNHQSCDPTNEMRRVMETLILPFTLYTGMAILIVSVFLLICDITSLFYYLRDSA